MKKRLFLGIMLLAALFLAGCITLKIENDIRPDGSGEKWQIIAVDIEAVKGFAQSMGVTPEPGVEEKPLEDSFRELEQKAATIPGATVEEYRDPVTGREGIKVTAPFADLDELVALSSTELFGNVDTIGFQQSGSSTTMNITVSTSDLSEEVSESAGEGGEEATPSPEEKAMQQQMLQMMDIEFTYSVIVPGAIVAYNPKDSATLEGNKITWDLSQALLETEAASVDLMVQWEGGGALPPPPAPPAEITPGAPPPQPQQPSQPAVTPGAGGPGLQPSEEKKARLPCCPAGLLPFGLIGTGALLFRRKGLR